MIFFDDYADFKERQKGKKLTLAESEKPRETPHVPQPLTYPEGLLGEIAQFFYNSSPRPTLETAIMGAIGFLSGMTGKAYNISRTGLNQYCLLLAQTGTGKEGMATGIDKLVYAIAQQVPCVLDFVGPAEIASGQALLKYLNTSTCFVSVVGEFGLKLQQLASPKASSSEIMLKRVLLDLYNKSGHNKMLRASVYADKDKNTETIMSPAFSILGESTPETFYGALTHDLISDGLLPRFMCVEYTGKRPPLNKNHDEHKPSPKMLESACTLAKHCLHLMHAKKVVDVQLDHLATVAMDKIDADSTDRINESEEDVIRHLWNRAHIKTLKLAALVAVGVNPIHPVITLSMTTWAYNLVANDIYNLTKRFEKGEIGRNCEESRQLQDLIRVILEYFARDYSEVEKYGVYESMYKRKMIPYSYIHRRLVSLSSFRNDRQSATTAIKRTIETLVESGELARFAPHQVLREVNKRGFAYMLCDPEMFFHKYTPQSQGIESAPKSFWAKA
jgi:hypothetical protein